MGYFSGGGGCITGREAWVRPVAHKTIALATELRELEAMPLHCSSIAVEGRAAAVVECSATQSTLVCRWVSLSGINGLVVAYIVAIDLTQIRFPADASVGPGLRSVRKREAGGGREREREKLRK